MYTVQYVILSSLLSMLSGLPPISYFVDRCCTILVAVFEVLFIISGKQRFCRMVSLCLQARICICICISCRRFFALLYLTNRYSSARICIYISTVYIRNTQADMLVRTYCIHHCRLFGLTETSKV
jgi:hypothetical protein